uniref:Zinc finger, CCHC-type n=1 Tax=Tanacetum cinerariifolium TaxID=118510 RepID=A0A6L2NTT2_TANCI|nr:zinc finger, CCHC-type [Tanacetum cinerariifolium]
MVAAIKHMALSFSKLEKFEWVDFRIWKKKKMHVMLSSMSVVYVLTTPMPEDEGENLTVEQNVETSKELWDILEAKYMAEDASSKKFLVSNFLNYKMTDSRPVLEQYNKLLRILGRFTQHKMNIDKSIQVSCIIDKLPLSWKDFKHTLKHIKEKLTPIELGSHLCIEKSLKVQDSDKPKRNNVAGPSVVNMVEHNNSFEYNDNKAFFVQDDDVAWLVDSRSTVHVCKDRCGFKTYESLNDGSIIHMENESTALVHRRGCVDLRLGHVHFKMMQDMSKDGLIPAIDMDTKKCKTCMLNKITKKLYQTVKRETKVLKLIHNDLYNLHATLSLGNKKYFVIFIDDASRAAVWLPDPKLKTLGERGIKCIFVGYVEHSKAFRSLVKGTEDSGGSVVSERVTAINDEMDSIMGNNTWVLTNLPPDYKPLGCKWIFKRKLKMDVKTAFLNEELKEEVYMNQPLGFIMLGNENKVDLTKDFLSSRFSMKDMGEVDVILGIRIKHDSNVSTPLNTYEKLMPNRGLTASNTQNCITSSTIESEIVALEATGKEAEWLKNLLLEIPLWVKPMAPISIRCDSAATLVKAYSQMYNGKSRHLGVRHSMICELITNAMVSIEFVRSNLWHLFLSAVIVLLHWQRLIAKCTMGSLDI